MPVIVVPEDSRLPLEMLQAGSNLVVVDFTASWCGPCQRIAPFYEEMSNKYASRGAVFLKVDVDRCPESAATHSVSAMPTFMFFRNRQRLAKVQGADPTSLEAKIVELLGNSDLAAANSDGTSSSDSGIAPGHMDLSSMIMKNGLECLNESDDHTLADALIPGSGSFLESDCDEQLIINVSFSQNVKLHSIRIDGPADCGPKTIKLFMNQPQTLDFDKADSMEPIQLITLTQDDLTNKIPINLRYVKFQNVSNLLIFVKDNQTGTETTKIHHIKFIGSPVSTTNMSDFKRIAGKKGESH